MTYNEFIQQILDTRGRFGIPEGEYKERHHIIPRCVDGEDTEDNLIDLYPREHFIAHYLLAEENPTIPGLQLALWNFLHRKPSQYADYEIAADEYAKCKEHYIETLSMKLSGAGNPFYGKKHSPETRRKLSLSKMGKTPWMKGKHYTVEAIEANKLAHLGKKDSFETKAKKSIATSGSNNPRAKAVRCIETDEIFDCIKYACEAYNLDKHQIIDCCKGRKETAGGYHWEYVDK